MTNRNYVAHPRMSPLDRPLLITTFKSAGAFEKREHRKSLRELAPFIERRSAPTKKRLPWIKLATFGNLLSDHKSLRHDDNVLTIDGIEIDYDGEKVPMREAAELFQKAGAAALLSTSPSGTAAKHRWRAFLPSSAPLPPEDRETHVAAVNGLLGGIVAPESFNLSQAYYYGKVKNNPDHEVMLVDGAYVDMVEFDVESIGRYGDAFHDWEPEPDDDELRAEPDWDRIDSALAAISVECRTDRERYYRPIGMALHHECRGSEEGWARWDAWAQGDGKVECFNYYGPDDTRYTWNSFGKPGKTKPLRIATLYYLAKKHGWSERSAYKSRIQFLTPDECVAQPPRGYVIKETPKNSAAGAGIG